MHDDVVTGEGQYEVVLRPPATFGRSVLDTAKAPQSDPLAEAEMRDQAEEGVRASDPHVLTPEAVHPQPHGNNPAVQASRHSRLARRDGQQVSAGTLEIDRQRSGNDGRRATRRQFDISECPFVGIGIVVDDTVGAIREA